MFEEAGITEDDISTWDGFIESGKKLKEKTGNYMFGINKACTGNANCGDTWQIITALQNSFYLTPTATSP